jgi:phosphopantothenoylcysteine decarboxylase/phosphopantothenate--cysteine ligase
MKKIAVMVTAGATREYLDPVRFLSNASSGLMGYLTAEAAGKDGASVTLISGPTNLPPPSNVRTIFVQSASEMYEQVMKYFPKTDIFISSAAVSDYRPANASAIYSMKLV